MRALLRSKAASAKAPPLTARIVVDAMDVVSTELDGIDAIVAVAVACIPGINTDACCFGIMDIIALVRDDGIFVPAAKKFWCKVVGFAIIYCSCTSAGILAERML